MSRLGATRIKLTSEDVIQFDDAKAASSQISRQVVPEEAKIPSLFDPSKSFGDSSVFENLALLPRTREANQ